MDSVRIDNICFGKHSFLSDCAVLRNLSLYYILVKTAKFQETHKAIREILMHPSEAREFFTNNYKSRIHSTRQAFNIWTHFLNHYISPTSTALSQMHSDLLQHAIIFFEAREEIKTLLNVGTEDDELAFTKYDLLEENFWTTLQIYGGLDVRGQTPNDIKIIIQWAFDTKLEEDEIFRSTTGFEIFGRHRSNSPLHRIYRGINQIVKAAGSVTRTGELLIILDAQRPKYTRNFSTHCSNVFEAFINLEEPYVKQIIVPRELFPLPYGSQANIVKYLLGIQINGKKHWEHLERLQQTEDDFQSSQLFRRIIEEIKQSENSVTTFPVNISESNFQILNYAIEHPQLQTVKAGAPFQSMAEDDPQFGEEEESSVDEEYVKRENIAASNVAIVAPLLFLGATVGIIALAS